MPACKSRAIARKKRKKNKGFKGIQYQEVGPSFADQNLGHQVSQPQTSTPARKDATSSANASKRKLANSSFEEIDTLGSVLTRQKSRKLGLSASRKIRDVGDDDDDSFSIIQLQCLIEAFEKAVVCRVCKSSKSEMKLQKDERKKHGLAEHFILKCSECLHETKFNSSKKVANGIFEVNKRSVILCNSSKGGRQTLADFCATMNLPAPLASASFARHTKSISQVMQQEAEIKMSQAAKRIRKLVLEKNPNADKQDKDGAIPVTISIDGTWHKRGYSSKYGVVIAILVDTGEVIDFEVLSKHCYQCKQHQGDDKDSEKYKKWRDTHAATCNINHQGSSGEMEGVGALKIFSRSIEKHKLKYATFVGDGDSDTFKVVKEGVEKIYGSRYQVAKEECIGHIQKRMGNALRRYVKEMKGNKMNDNKTVGGKGRLTKLKIDQIQRYYGQAIRKHVGNLEEMQKAIWAIFFHTVTSPGTVSMKIQHQYCPKGNESWCKFNNNLETGKKTYDESGRLPPAFYEPLKPIFKRLSTKELLQKCQKGLTQNANESLNNLIWQRCPKTMFFGKERVVSAVSEAVCVFNTGAGAKALIMKAAGVNEMGSNFLSALRKRDNDRLVSASQKVSNKYKSWRWSKKKVTSVEKKKGNEHYEAGGFDSKGQKLCEVKRVTKRTSPMVSSTEAKRFKTQTKKDNKESSFTILESKSEDAVMITSPEPLAIILPVTN